MTFVLQKTGEKIGFHLLLEFKSTLTNGWLGPRVIKHCLHEEKNISFQLQQMHITFQEDTEYSDILSEI